MSVRFTVPALFAMIPAMIASAVFGCAPEIETTAGTPHDVALGPVARVTIPDGWTAPVEEEGRVSIESPETSARLIVLATQDPTSLVLLHRTFPGQFADVTTSSRTIGAFDWELHESTETNTFAALARSGEWAVLAIGIEVDGPGQRDALLRGLAPADGHPRPNTGPADEEVTWNFVLMNHTAGLSRVEISAAVPASIGEAPLWHLDDPAAVQELLGLIKIVDEGSGFHCMCMGTFNLLFEGDDVEPLTLSYHHGRSFRWMDGPWPGDGLLTPDSQHRIPEWLADHGFTAVRDERDAELSAAKRQADEFEAFVNCFPTNVRQLFQPTSQRSVAPDATTGDANTTIGGRIAALMDDPVAVADAASRALAISSESWTSTTEKERIAIGAALTVDGASFARAIEQMKADEPALIGAARLFFREELGDRIKDRAIREQCSVRLAEAVLTRGRDTDKPAVLRRLWRVNIPDSIDLLARVLAGETGQEIERTPFYGTEPGIRSGAAIALGHLRVESMRDLITSELERVDHDSDRAAFDVALALLGDHTKLHAGQIRIPSYSIGEGMIVAIERLDGRHGMELLVGLILDHPWYGVNESAFFAFERITGQDWSSKKPRNMRVLRYKSELLAWWVEHGTKFVQARHDRE